MKPDSRQRLRARLQSLFNLLLLIVVIVLAGWLTQQYRYTADWTDSARNTLTRKSLDVIRLLEQPVRISAFVTDDAAIRDRIEGLIARYRRAGADIELEFINPETRPGLARELGIRGTGEMIVRLGEASERLQRISEQSITNALAQMGRDRTRWIVFIEGHGERDPLGDANFDLGTFGERLQDRGYRVQTLNLARQQMIPDNADLVVLASPRSDYLPGELERLRQYLGRGRNLLWLTDPGADEYLGELPAWLGVEPLPGTVVDAGAETYGAESPDFAVTADFPSHSVTRGFDRLALFPEARALQTRELEDWSHTDLIRTGEESWTETGTIGSEEDIEFDAGEDEQAGPLTIALAAERGDESGQRIAVVGDGDWLSNAYLENGGNLELGLRLFGWLLEDDERIEIAPDQPADMTVELTRPLIMMIGTGFLLILPALFAACGLVIWLRRRRR